MIGILVGIVLFIITIPIKTTKLAITTSKGLRNISERVNSIKRRKQEESEILKSGDEQAKKDLEQQKADEKKSKVVEKSRRFGKKAGKLAIKTAIKALKLLVLFLQWLGTLFFAFGLIGGLLMILVWYILLSGVVYVAVLMDSNSSGSFSFAGGNTSTPDSTTNTSTAVASDWKIVSQSDYADVAYSDSDVAECGCGLCSIYVVSEHYSGNKDTFTVQSCASEVNEKYPSNGTNRNRAVVTEWFNTMHPELGLTCEGDKDGDIDLDVLDATLANGGCAIVDYHDDVKYDGTSVWTSGGHYVTIISGNQNDGYMVRDSNGGHEHGTRGVAEWAPYSTHVFEKEYIQGAFYYYLLEKS